MKRFLSMLLIVSMLAGGCASKAKTASAPQKMPVVVAPTAPQSSGDEEIVQKSLTQEELAPIMQNTEYSLLAAAFLYDAYRSVRNSRYGHFAYVGDVDKDGQNEMYYSESLLYFDPTDGRSCGYMYSPSGSHGLYLAKDGSVYYSYYGELEFIPHADHEDSFSALRYRSRTPGAVSFDVCQPWCEDQQASWVRLEDRELTPEESKDFLQQLELTPVTTGLQDYTSFTYDAAYTDSILAALETAFGYYYYEPYSLVDIDRDGEEERLFFYKDFVPGWFPQEARNPNPESPDESMANALCFDYPGIDPDACRTGLIVADRQGKELILKAYSIPSEPPAYHEDNAACIQGAMLHLYGEDWLAPQALVGMQDTLATLEQQLRQQGYTDCFFTTADLSGAEEDEILCIARMEGVWCLLVIRFEYGIPKVLEMADLSTAACYLTEENGKKCLLTYSQRVLQKEKGLYTVYSYQLTRYDGNSGNHVLDSGYVGYYNDEEDAQAVSAFFEKLNRYIIKVSVLYDPFALRGQQWISPENVAHGTAPQEPQEQPNQPNQPEEVQKLKMGFVNINNPSSWLNLREGPGRDYPCIRIDPKDPGSIVKQAKGSPVTVLETVASEDAEFPVWYKVRIRYQDRDIIGYSAEAYIKLAE